MSQNYMTAEELAAFNEANNTKLKGDHYLAVNPKTGEEGAWMFTSQTGWTDASKLGGPRTHYEDGTPVNSFKDARKDWNPNWSIRLNDIFRWAGGQHGGAGRSMFTDDMWNWDAFNDPYWRTEEGRQWVNQQAIGNKSLDEIYREMAGMGERADKVNAIKSGSNPLVSTSRDGMMQAQQRSNSYNQAHQQEQGRWDIDSDVPQSFVDEITKKVDESWAASGKANVIGKTGDNRYMFGDADLPDGLPPPPNDGSEYQWVGSMGWTKVGGFTPRDRQLTIEAGVRNSYGFDDLEVKGMRVANTGALGWFMGGDQGGYMDINPDDQDDILAMFQEDGYNPYYGRGFNNSKWRERAIELKGGDDSFLDPWKNRYDNNIMDYLYDKTKRTTGNRWNVKHAFSKWMAEKGLREVDLFRTYMTPARYEEMGLEEFLGAYDDTYSDGMVNRLRRSGSSGTGSFLSSYNRQREALGQPAVQVDTNKGFLGAYLDQKDKLSKKNSVKSLFNEMEEYQGE
jgi:hypothetical protein